MRRDVIYKEFDGIDPRIWYCAQIVVYHKTKDYGDKFVARVFAYDQDKKEYIPTNAVVVGDTFAEIEKKIPFFFTWIDRMEQDVPCIVGAYI